MTGQIKQGDEKINKFHPQREEVEYLLFKM